MAAQRHADHDYIKARQHHYSKAWKSGSVEELIEFFDKDDFIYSHHGQSASSPQDALHNALLIILSQAHRQSRNRIPMSAISSTGHSPTTTK